MKLKLIIVGLLFGMLSSYADTGLQTKTRFGTGEDSIQALIHINMLKDNVSLKNFIEAESSFKFLYPNYPYITPNLYAYGAQIWAWKIDNEQDEAKKKELLNELMDIYNARIKYMGDNKQYPTGRILADKVINYYKYSDKNIVDMDSLNKWGKESIALMQENTNVGVVSIFLTASSALAKASDEHKAVFMEDYTNTNELLDKMLAAATDEKEKESIIKMKEYATTLLANSGAADCETLIGLYTPQLEENKANAEFLNQMLSMLRRSKCTDSELYFQASTYSHAISPTAESAAGLANQAIKQENSDKAIAYYEEALKLSDNNEDKAEYAYRIALVYQQMKRNLPKAREYARESLKYKPNNGQPYILISQLYSESAKSIYPSDPIKQRTVYYAVVDKLVKAKEVDPSVAGDVDKRIAQYRQLFPSKEDLFMHNELDAGKTITIGGWIQEKTVCR